MKKILFLAICAVTVSAYALPTYEPFTEFAPTLAAHPVTLTVTTTNGNSIGTNANSYVTNCLDLSTNGLLAPSGEQWGEIAYAGLTTGGAVIPLHGLDVAIISNVTIFPQSSVASILPFGFPGLPESGQSITNFVENSSQPFLWVSTNFALSNYCGNSAVLKFASDVTRPGSGTKTLFFSYLLNVAQQGQLGAGNNGRYLALLSATNLALPSASYPNWDTFFNTFVTATNTNAVHYAAQGLLQQTANSTFYIGGCDSTAGKNWSTTPLTASYASSVFVVGCYQFNASGSDSNIMWLSPSTGTFGGPAPPNSSIFAFKMGFNMSDIGGLALIDRVGNNASGGVGTNYIANLIIGSTWSYVTGGPEFTSQPVGFTGSAGANCSFTAQATAAGQSVGFQWQVVRNGITNNLSDGVGTAGGSATVSGSLTSTLSLSGISSGDAGAYQCLATAGGTSFTLTSATVQLKVDPSVNSQPQNAVANYQGQATFTATASTSQSSLSYQWFYNGTPLTNGVQADGSIVSGASGTVASSNLTTTLTLTNLSYLDQGGYNVFITNNVNSSSFSASASLTVNDPIIATQPTNQSVVTGGTATFSVVANGSPTLTYQWYANGNALSDGTTFSGSTISGSQTATLTISGVSDADSAAGPYSVNIFGNGSSQATNSVNVTLTVADPVTFVAGPVSRVERAGDHTAFQVVAAGNVLSYQWQFDGTNISGATSSALSLTNIQTANQGSYTAIVSNPATPGGVTSPSGTLTVINSQILPLASTNIIVARVGDGAQAYSGAAGNTIYFDQYTTNGAYVDTVQIPDENTNQNYGTGSASTVFGSPALLAQGGVGTDGIDSTFLTLSANGQEYLNFAGYCEQYPFSGANVTVGGGTFFRGLASLNAFGVYSLTYTNQGLYNGGNHTIRGTVTLDGTNFWTTGQAGANGVKFVNTTVSTYATGNGIPVITSSAAGSRAVEIVGGNLIFSDPAGASGSGLYACSGTPEPNPNGTVSSVALILNEGGQPADFAFSPDGQTVYIADSQSFAGTGIQSGGIQRWDTNTGGIGWVYSYTLQPLNNGTNGAQGLTVNFPTNITSWGAGVTGAVLYATTYGDTTNSLTQIVDNGASSTATLIATAGPNQAFRGVRFGPAAVPVSIATEPQSQTNFPNNNVTFTVGANGSQPIFYQWEFDGSPIPGATGSSFTTNNISLASGGNYSVIVSNLIPSSLTSSNATLLVTAGAPTFTMGVPSITEGAGDHLALAPVVNGSMPISAQWYLGANPLANQTNLTLVLTDIQAGESGTYTLKVTNLYGNAQSSGTLTITALQTPFSTNNLVVARIGDGAQALSGATGNTLYLDQYTASGTYVSSMQIPDEGAGQVYETGSSNAIGTGPAVILSGSNGLSGDANLGGLLTLSADNQTINFAGYCEAYPFSGADITINSSTNWRGIGAVNGVATYGLAYTNFGLYSAGNHIIHSAVTSDQTNYWTTGEASQSGVKYVNSGPSGAGYANGNGVPNVGGSGPGTRGIHIVNGNIFFVDTGATATPAGIWEFSGEPTAVTTPSSFMPETNSPVDFAMSPDQQTVYVADNSAFGAGGGIQRWDANPSVGGYTNSYTFSTGDSSTVGARGLTVDFSAQTSWGLGVIGAKIYATTAEPSGNRLIKIVDNGASSAATILAQATASSTFSGVSFGPSTTPVSIVSEPQNQTALTGTGAEFSVGVAGTAPFFYQWRFNGTNIAGATGSTLIVSAAQAVLPGSYSVIVSNLAPSIATSGPVSISFEPILSFFGNGAGWSLNGQAGAGVPVYNYNGGSNIVELTQSVGHQAAGTFYQAPVYVGGFLATWTYQVVNPSGTIADGMAFVVQNDSRGAAALGDTSFQTGGSFGYGAPGPITNSVALEFEIYTNSANGVGISLDTDGAIGPNVDPSPVVLGSGDPINVTMQYLNGLATVTLFDTVTSNGFTTNTPINIPATVGGQQAFVGFTAADGADFSTQTVSNFVYISLVDLTATPSGSNLILAWPVGVGGFTLQQSPALLSGNWTPVTNSVNVVNDSNQVVVPITGNNNFYRLVNP